jgi:hypothetical protein
VNRQLRKGNIQTAIYLVPAQKERNVSQNKDNQPVGVFDTQLISPRKLAGCISVAMSQTPEDAVVSVPKHGSLALGTKPEKVSG